MATKSSPSMIRRYTGADGRKRLIDSLCTQPSVAGNRTIAQKYANAGQLIDVRSGRSIITQGDSDNDFFLIISGQVGIVINGRQIAIRTAGHHVGEMALLDSTVRRSTTVTTLARSVFLKVSESEVARIAKQYPDLWRRIAIEVSARLRERSQFISQPHADPVVFVGSSSEASREAAWVSDSLNPRPVVCRPWTQGVSQLSKTAIEDLTRMASDSDFSVLILTPDDMTASRGKKKTSPRDNVVFELGLFMGSLGRDRTFIVTPRGVDMKLPTDLLGITHVPFTTGTKKTLGKRLSPVTRAIWRRMQDLGVK